MSFTGDVAVPNQFGIPYYDTSGKLQYFETDHCGAFVDSTGFPTKCSGQKTQAMSMLYMCAVWQSLIAPQNFPQGTSGQTATGGGIISWSQS